MTGPRLAAPTSPMGGGISRGHAVGAPSLKSGLPLHRVSRRIPFRLGLLATLMVLIAAPVAAVLVQGAAAPDDLWRHLLATVFWTYVTNSVTLCLVVGACPRMAVIRGWTQGIDRDSSPAIA